MCPFKADAKEISIIEGEDLVLTSAIREFIKTGEEDHLHFVVAPKGGGKTLFLKYKRNLYHKNNKGVYFIPRDYPIETGHSLVQLTHEKLELLENYEKWISLWKVCISLSIIKNLIKLYKPTGYEDLENCLDAIANKRPQPPEEIRTLIVGLDIISIFGILNNILRLSFANIIKIIDMDYQIEELIKSMHYDVVTFIDNLDQRFERYLRSNDITKNSVWFSSQMGLMKAINELSAINGFIKVSASIRKEAFEKMKIETELALQLIGETLDIRYTKPQLKEMFLKNIKQLTENYLIDSKYKQSDLMYAFLGLKDNKLKSIKDQEEDAFDYIYRHTLKRPRDLMTIGSFLCEIDTIERTSDNIKRVVNEAAFKIAETFLTEMKPFTEINNFNDVFDLIHCNILSGNDIKSICSTYNNQPKCTDNCKECGKVHIFCDLYKFGLLGVIEYKEIYSKFKQEFLQIGDRVFESKILPHSDYYLIHPILNDIIKDRNLYSRTEFKIADVIIGDGYEWKGWKDDQRYCSLIRTICNSKPKMNKNGVFLISSKNNLSLITELKSNLEKEFEIRDLSIEIEDWLKKEGLGTSRIFHNEICPKIFRNSWILAEVSDCNPNVFFECGFAMGLGRNVIFLCNDHAEEIKSKIGTLYITYKTVQEIIEKLSRDNFFRAKIENENLFRIPTVFGHIKDFNLPNKRQKKGINILSYNSEIPIITKLTSYNYNLININMLGNDLIDPNFIGEIIDSKILLVRVSGRKDGSNTLSKLHDAHLMYLAGICVSQGVPTLIFQSNTDFYNDVRDISKCDITGGEVINFVENQPYLL